MDIYHLPNFMGIMLCTAKGEVFAPQKGRSDLIAGLAENHVFDFFTNGA